MTGEVDHVEVSGAEPGQQGAQAIESIPTLLNRDIHPADRCLQDQALLLFEVEHRVASTGELAMNSTRNGRFATDGGSFWRAEA